MAHAGGQQLAVSDVDTAPDELEFEVVEAPVHGELIKTDGNTKIRMTNGKVQHTDTAGIRGTGWTFICLNFSF